MRQRLFALKLIEILNNDIVRISFRDIDTINDNMIISIFTKWYMNKDKAIQKHKEMRERLNNKKE